MSMCLKSKEQERLVLENHRLVYYIVNKLGVSKSDYEDMISIGTIGLIKAAATFNESKEIKFGTYAVRCINNEIFMYFRKDKKRTQEVSLESSCCNDDEGNELTIGDKLSVDEDFTETLVNNETFSRIINIVLNCLPPRERLIMLYKISGIGQVEVAERLDLSQSYISRIERNLGKKIKSYFESNKQFEEVFSMSMKEETYSISFASKDVKQFNKIFAKLLRETKIAEELPDFDVKCNNDRISIIIPAYPEAFVFIAKIIEQIDNFSITYTSKN